MRPVANLLRIALLAAATAAFALPTLAADVPKIAFVGDSMADGLWGAFFRLAGRNKCGEEQLKFIRNARNGTGLARPDHFDWNAALADLLAREQPTLVFASIGLNDRQDFITAGKQRLHYGTEGWLAAYRQNVEAFYASAAASGAPVLVVGLPNLKEEKLNTHATLVNDVYAGTASGVTYLEPYRLVRDDGGYTSFGPNLSGQTVQLRAADGVHFTPAGYDVIAAHLAPALREALEAAGTPPGACLGG
jgi:uncharacterized protein